jgi:hypothetical protein
MICKPLHGQLKIQQNESHFKHPFSYINQSLSSQLPKVKCIHKGKSKQPVTQIIVLINKKEYDINDDTSLSNITLRSTLK